VPRRSKVVILAALAAVGVIIPLFGDPRLTPVTHPLWARMLLRALEMEDAVKASTHASALFTTLSGRHSRMFGADAYLRADGVVASGGGTARRISATDGVGEVTFAVAIVQSGDYTLRARVSGDPARPVSAEIAAGGRPAIRTFSLVPGREPNWILGGAAHLDPGTYTAAVLLPPGASLEYVEVAPPCVNPVEPIGGWQPAAITTSEDLAVTALRALDMEDALAPADTPIERSGADFARDDATAVTAVASDSGLEGGRNGVEARLVVDLPEAGLYTLEAFVEPGAGQRWHADGCRKVILCAGSPAGWRAVMTQSFSAGPHNFAVALADGAVVERVRLTRRKATPADYVAALHRVGFDPGEGTVSRRTAAGAMDFVRGLHVARQGRFCGDVLRPPTAPTRDASPTTTVAAGAPAAPVVPPTTGGGGGPSTTPLSGTILPPQQQASPVLPGPS
jgi:hypothetical protein